ncbi:polysaccharide biosynthesis/export family protein [Noviherbaspirillum sp. 1P10PC]|uniref:polysaccharide biosynthesis/export family protein n=1 Tax=Noviherbaspirillum sp. 1P10PC TaxID=3132292 RepID=UPI0039A313CE
MHRPYLLATLLAALSAGGALAADSGPSLNLFSGGAPSPVIGAATAQPVTAPVAPAAANTAAAQPADQGMPPPLVAPQLADYAANLKSDVFGAQLFSGSFARPGPTQFNPDYMIAVGDRVQVRLWGGFSFDSVVAVDPQGNIFLPHAGPVKLLGVRNRDLQRVMEAASRQVFRNNVYSYASLAAAQPVRIFVGGNVNRPGLYNGTSMDSLLHYLDQAGGIDPERGSFLDVQVKRGEQVRTTVSLYDFMLEGRLPLIQLADGDVIFISPRRNTIQASGLAENAKRFEFNASSLTIAQLSRLAKPRAQATHVRVVRNTGTVRNVDYYLLADAANIAIGNGDEVEYTADKKPGTITVRVEGEHLSAQEYVLPYGARMGQLMQQIQFSERSDTQSVQLYRQSVRERQKTMLQASMKSLETTVLTARSGTSDEARLRREEADLILQWVERAKKVEPSGQVLIAQASSRDRLLLENGDVLKVPSRDGLVLVSGEVLFPNAIAYDITLSLDDYISRAGGYTQNADNSRVVVAHRDGSYSANGAEALRAGDEVLVLPRIDVKSRQIWKDMTQIIYQIAVSAKVVLGL